jgi:hypothetical protein
MGSRRPTESSGPAENLVLKEGIRPRSQQGPCVRRADTYFCVARRITEWGDRDQCATKNQCGQRRRKRIEEFARSSPAGEARIRLQLRLRSSDGLQRSSSWGSFPKIGLPSQQAQTNLLAHPPQPDAPSCHNDAPAALAPPEYGDTPSAAGNGGRRPPTKATPART